MLEAAVDIWGERRRRIGTGELNRLLTDSTDRFPPPVVRGRRPKLFYATQAAVAPPTFVFFASDAGSVHFSYRRYLENRLRETFGFDGTPIRLVFRDRTSVKLPRRKRNPGKAGGPKASMSKGSKPKASGSSGRGDETGSGAERDAPRSRTPDRPGAGTLMDGPRVAVVGAGAWGTTLARVIARVEPVTLVCHSAETAATINATGQNARRLPGVELPKTVIATADVATLASDAMDLVLFAAPSAHLRTTAAATGPFLAGTADVLSVVKGLERGSLLRMSEVIAEGARDRSGRGSPRCPDRTWPPKSRATCRHRRSWRPRTWTSPSGSSHGWPAGGSACT